nr:uncharacterized protein CTRU02_07045 [Colletotrichum truncatum]KAF6791861.1 hypothetical protein CTRU02_07045 [Colletotrichum truncatum]
MILTCLDLTNTPPPLFHVVELSVHSDMFLWTGKDNGVKAMPSTGSLTHGRHVVCIEDGTNHGRLTPNLTRIWALLCLIDLPLRQYVKSFG